MKTFSLVAHELMVFEALFWLPLQIQYIVVYSVCKPIERRSVRMCGVSVHSKIEDLTSPSCKDDANWQLHHFQCLPLQDLHFIIMFDVWRMCCGVIEIKKFTISSAGFGNLPGSVGLSWSAWFYARTFFSVLFCFQSSVSLALTLQRLYIFPPLCFMKAYFLLLKCSLFPILYLL